MTPEYRILIVGGYGTFGGRLVELLENDARLTLLIAGRSLEQARTYCAQRQSAVATLVPTFFDRLNSDATVLAQLRATIVVDASGPFQAYGDQRYSLIERCIECGVNYLDLADGSDFVSGVAKFDDAARSAGIYVLSGVSSFPVLTAAVVRHLSGDVLLITSIRGGIAPSPYAGVGVNVIRAIASYAGQPIVLKRGGKLVTAYPITESMRFTIAVPGHVPLKNIRFSLVDVPDLQTLTRIWPQADDVWMGAGPVPAILHWLLTGFAWVVRLRLMPSLLWLASAIYFVTNHVRWGEHRGGMFVEIRGKAADGSTIKREWHLLAEGKDGPLIPSMAVEAIVRKSLSGQVPVPGARTAISDVNLSDYQELFARRTIFTGVRQREPIEVQPLFHHILGEVWDILPLPIKQLHSITSVSMYSGRCTVTQGSNPIARAVTALVGFPKSGADLPIVVKLLAEGAGEKWVRTVGDRTFSSTQRLAKGRSEGLVCERFGILAVDMALVFKGSSLTYVIRRWSLLGMPMPLWLGPKTTASESTDAEGRFSFDIKLWHPFIGLLVHYAGWLCPGSK
jgi:Domain of unknown function (DUF4166)/Saccharopine dehydrogenase NADP binding domain